MQRGAGSEILSGVCAVTPDGDEATSDEILAADPGSFKSLNEAFDYLSRVDQQIVWSRQKDGVVEVRDKRATAEILHLQIKQFELKDAVTLQDAVDKLLLAPEVKFYLDQHRLESPTVYNSSYVSNENHPLSADSSANRRIADR